MNIETMNADELQALMLRTIDELRDGSITAAQANTITRAVGQRLTGMRAAMKSAKLAGTIDPLPSPRPIRRT